MYISCTCGFKFLCLCCIILCFFCVGISLTFYPTLSPILCFKPLTTPLSFTSALSSFKPLLHSLFSVFPSFLHIFLFAVTQTAELPHWGLSCCSCVDCFNHVVNFLLITELIILFILSYLNCFWHYFGCEQAL